MQTVSRFEANLLRLLYFFLRREPAERAVKLLEERMPAPPCLGKEAVRLVKDALAKGCVFLLAQRGGWRDERHLRGGKAAAGRLWQRTPPPELGLQFSQHTLAFLVWITAARPGDKDRAWNPPVDQLTPADLLLLFFAHEALRQTSENLGASILRARSPFIHHGLCWLAYPEDFTNAPATVKPDFGPWTTELGSAIVEALQPVLAARWFQVESAKVRINEAGHMRQLGRSQERVLTAFLDALESAGRRDLARFLIKSAHALLRHDANAGMWTGGLDLSGARLADRAATYQAAAGFLRQLDRLHAWTRAARAVSYFEEGYAAAQLWLADWEHFQGDALTARAHAILRDLDPLRQAQEARPTSEPAARTAPGQVS
jgi:hypothetical protein